MVLKDSVKITNVDNTDQTFMQEPSDLDYSFAISSLPLKSTSDTECAGDSKCSEHNANLDQTIPSRAF